VAVKEVNLMPSADDVSLVPDADVVGTRDGICVDERAENIGSLLLASPGADIIKGRPYFGATARPSTNCAPEPHGNCAPLRTCLALQPVRAQSDEIPLTIADRWQ